MYKVWAVCWMTFCMKLFLCLFFFSFVWDIYLTIFLNIIIYISVYSEYHIIIEKINILWSTNIPILIAEMFYLQNNIMHNELEIPFSTIIWLNFGSVLTLLNLLFFILFINFAKFWWKKTCNIYLVLILFFLH